MDIVVKAIHYTVKELFGIDINIELTHPESYFGDLASNVAMQLAKPLKQAPLQIAEQITRALNENPKNNWLKESIVAKPGFINIWLNDGLLINVLNEVTVQGKRWGHSQINSGMSILVEYLDPNPFKEIHIGHAYTGTIGDAIANLFEVMGGKVHRVTYQGDVGLHVAKAIYAILKNINNDPTQLDKIADVNRPKFLGEAYAAGAKAYETDENAKIAIQAINKQVYEQTDLTINQVHAIGVAWSMQYFETVYQNYNFTNFEKNYLESMVASRGLKIVKDHIEDGIFEQSNGAVIFKGEKFGLHTRVFINSNGLPTYEAKDLGNAMLKWRDYHYDKSIIITSAEQADYFQVMLKALEQFAPQQAISTQHIAHGTVTTSHGKMSSRTGDVIRALDLLHSAEIAAKAISLHATAPTHDIALAAIKYAFLKNKIGGDIVYDSRESMSLEGNSGPYIQYAHARARSILSKSHQTQSVEFNKTLDEWERRLLLKISEYPTVLQKATTELMPHYVCTYLYELAQNFNRFYEHDKVIGASAESERLTLVSAYAIVLENGLGILKIPAPTHM